MAIVTYAHGPLTPLASNLWLVSAPTSQGLDRKMCVVRAATGELFLHDALWLDEPTFAQLDRLGRVDAIFVPSARHDFDGLRFARRYPRARLCAPPATVRRLRWPGLAALDPASLPGGVTVRPIPGLARDEPVCEVRHPEGGLTQIYADALFNLPHARGWRGRLLRLIGSSGPLHLTPLGRLFLLDDRVAFRGFLEEQAARAELRHLVVGHGEVISTEVRARLAEAARRV